MLLLRALARLVGLLWTLALALVGLGVALYCLDGAIRLGAARPDRLLHLGTVRREVGRFLFDLAAPGPTARLALAAGVGAILIGMLLLIGLLRGRPARRAVLGDHAQEGRLTVRPRALRQALRALAAEAPGVTTVPRLRLSLSRRGTRGRLRLQATHTATREAIEVREAINQRLASVSGPFGLRTRIHLRPGEAGERVQ